LAATENAKVWTSVLSRYRAVDRSTFSAAPVRNSLAPCWSESRMGVMEVKVFSNIIKYLRFPRAADCPCLSVRTNLFRVRQSYASDSTRLKLEIDQAK
jgi:hypothetical protein